MPTPTRAEALIRAVDDLEAMGFRVQITLECIPYPHGQGYKQIIEHLCVFDPLRPRRRPPEGVMLLVMGHARGVRGYLRRLRSPFFDGDREGAMACAMADDARLRQHGR